MLRTIRIGSTVLVQGLVTGSLPDGRLVISVGDKTFVGHPVPVLRAA